MEKLIVKLGFNNEILQEQPSLIHNNTGGLLIWQYPNQFSKYIVLLKSLNIKSYLEIGCRWGGTFVLTCEYLSRFNVLDKCVAVDIIDSPVSAYCSTSPNKTFICMNSTSDEFKEYMKGNMFDAIFIDGDHSYEGVKNDYEMAKYNGNVYIFHDIHSMACPGVVKFWNELKNTMGELYDFYEFTEQYSEVVRNTGQTFLGIGVAVKKLKLYTVVVAKYNEDLSWLNKLDNENVVIYNKGIEPVKNAINRINIGREGETFLYHIIRNYDMLPEYLILLQGDPFPHMWGITPDTLQESIYNYIRQSPTDALCLLTGNYMATEPVDEYIGIDVSSYYSLLFDGPVPSNIVFSAGGQYIIPKKNILARPIQFYTRLHSMIFNSKITNSDDAHYVKHEFDETSIHGWCLERLYKYIFMPEVPINKSFI